MGRHPAEGIRGDGAYDNELTLVSGGREIVLLPCGIDWPFYVLRVADGELGMDVVEAAVKDAGGHLLGRSKRGRSLVISGIMYCGGLAPRYGRAIVLRDMRSHPWDRGVMYWVMRVLNW